MGLGTRAVSIQFSLNWLVGICLVAVGLIIGFAFAPAAARPALVFAAAVIATSAGLITAINNLDQRAAQSKQAKIHAALECAYRWNSPTLHQCKKAGREVVTAFKTMHHDPAKMAYLNEDPDRLGNLIALLNWFEALHIAITAETVDEDTAKRFFRSVVLEYWHTTEWFVKKRRVERNNTRLLTEFEALFVRWS